MVEKQQFKQDGTDRYVLDIPLVDDGCPGSEQFLQIVVTTTDAHAEVSIVLKKHMARELCSFYSTDTSAIAQLLYGAARLVTVQEFQAV